MQRIASFKNAATAQFICRQTWRRTSVFSDSRARVKKRSPTAATFATFCSVFVCSFSSLTMRKPCTRIVWAHIFRGIRLVSGSAGGWYSRYSPNGDVASSGTLAENAPRSAAVLVPVLLKWSTECAAVVCRTAAVQVATWPIIYLFRSYRTGSSCFFVVQTFVRCAQGTTAQAVVAGGWGTALSPSDIRY